QSETFVQRGFLQPFDAEAGLAPRLEFGTQSPRVASRTRQIQAWRFAPTDIADFIGNRVQLRNGVLASLVGRDRIPVANKLRQWQQLGVDFVLQQRGAGGGAAPADV